MARIRAWLIRLVVGKADISIDYEVDRTYAKICPHHEAYDEQNKQAIRECILRVRNSL